MLTDSLQRLLKVAVYECLRWLKLVLYFVIDIGLVHKQELLQVARPNLTATGLDEVEQLSDLGDGPHIAHGMFQRLTLFQRLLITLTRIHSLMNAVP